MTRFKKYSSLIAAIIVLVALMIFAKVEVIPAIKAFGTSGVVVDKFEGEKGLYILLDTNCWVKVDDISYIGLDIGDFYEAD